MIKEFEIFYFLHQYCFLIYRSPHLLLNLISSSDLCVNDVVSQPRADIAELGDPDGDLPDEVHLAAQELVLQEITEMRVPISHPVGGEQTLIHLQFQI